MNADKGMDCTKGSVGCGQMVAQDYEAYNKAWDKVLEIGIRKILEEA